MSQKNVKRRKAGGSRKRASAFHMHRKSAGMICIVLILLAGVLGVNSIKLYQRNTEYKKQESELQAQIKEEKQRAKDIEKYQTYVQSDEYVKEVAEEKLGLVDPNEVVFEAQN